MKRALVAVALLGCKDPKAHDSSRTGDRDLDHALALRDQAPTGVARWPAGTTRLAGDRVIDEAVDHGAELIAAVKGALLRIPKDGGPATTLAEFPGAGIRDLVLTSSHAIVGVFPNDPEGVGVKGPGKLLAVPLAGGPPIELATGVDILVALATAGDDLYTCFDHREVFVAHEPALAKRTRVAGLPAPTHDDARTIDALVADGKSVGWIETDYTSIAGKIDTKSAVGRADAAPIALAIHLYGSSVRSDGGRWYTLATASSSAATAPGGGTYYEDAETLIAIDPATGRVTTESPPLENTWGMAVANGSACIAVGGPKLEFGKQTKVVSWRTGQAATTTLATGLLHARVLAIDANRCYVVEVDKPGLAAVPYSR